MYPILPNVLELFTYPFRQVAELTIDTIDDIIIVSEVDIIEGGLNINRYSSSGSTLEIGSVSAGELTLILDNRDGQFDDVRFEGAEINVRVGIADWNIYTEDNAEYFYVPMGYFTVDKAPRKLERIQITALDRMIRFDKPVVESQLAFPMNIATLTDRICYECNVPLLTDMTTLPNWDYVVEDAPAENYALTYRQYLSWIGEITGSCGFINWNGQLEMKWYEPTGLSVDSSVLTSSDLQENSITISGVRLVDGETVYLAGTADYAINIASNAFITHDHETLVANLDAVLTGFTYTPFTATVISMPHLYPLDMLEYVDKNEISHPVVITTINFKMNDHLSFKGIGKSETEGSWALANPFTRKETIIIKSIVDESNAAVNNRVQDVLAFNELISSALGLYSTEVSIPEGGKLVYLHDKRTLSESSFIFTMTSEGIAWTDQGWNDGNPSWMTGTTAAGDAMYRFISARGLRLSQEGELYNIEITPRAFQIFFQNMMVASIIEDEMRIPKVISSEYFGVGRIKLIPSLLDSTLIGTDIVFLDDEGGI